MSAVNTSCTALLIITLILPCLSKGASGLLNNSPFLPPEVTAQAEGTRKMPATPRNIPSCFSLKGISQIMGVYYFNVMDSRTNTSMWIQAKETVNGFCIHNYNPGTRTIGISWNNTTYNLKLSKANGHPVALDFNSGTTTVDKPIDPQAQHGENQKIYFKTQHAAIKQRAAAENGYSLTQPRLFAAPRSALVSSGHITTYKTGQRSEVTKPIVPTTAGTLALPQLSEQIKIPVPSLLRVNRVNNPGGKPPDHLL